MVVPTLSTAGVAVVALPNPLYWRQRLYGLTPLPTSVKLNSALYRNLLKASEAWMKSQVPAAYGRNFDRWALDKQSKRLLERFL